MRAVLLAAAATAALVAAACGGGPKKVAAPKERTTPGLGLTVYSDWAVVKDWRTIRLGAKRGEVRFTDVPRLIDPTTVSFRSITDPATSVIEQTYENDLVSADKLLQKHLDRQVTLLLPKGKTVSGRLLAYDAARIVLDTGDATRPIEIVERWKQVKGIKLGGAGDLITKPTLVWLVDAARAGEQLVKVAYQTAGFAWSADYTAVVKKDGAELDVTGWVTITNNSGASFPDAELKLVAGDVNRVQPPVVALGAVSKAAQDEERDDKAQGFVEKAFFEYHMYTLGRATTLPDASIKQIEMFDPVLGVPAKKIFVYEGEGRKVDLYLELRNDEKSGLGMPLPAGRVRVYQLDEADGSLELVGEDRLEHTPKDEEVRLRLGNAFDVVAERKQTAYEVDSAARTVVESFELRLRNHKDVEIEVLARERLHRYVNWAITAQSDVSTKEAAQLVQYRVKVPAGGEKIVTYTVRYTW